MIYYNIMVCFFLIFFNIHKEPSLYLMANLNAYNSEVKYKLSFNNFSIADFNKH